MSNASLASRMLNAAVFMAVGATLAMIFQPSASTAARVQMSDHIFVPTTVALDSREQSPAAPTF